MLGKNQVQNLSKEPIESKVLEASEKAFTFTVDNVGSPGRFIPYATAQEVLERIVGKNMKVEDFSQKDNKEKCFLKGEMPGFFLALHIAYQFHYSVKLSVSDFIILIGQGLGRHLEKYSEKLREHFVDHQGKEEIKIRRDEFVIGKQNDWSTIFTDFSEQIKKRTKTDLHSIIVDDTSVATKDSRIVSEITLMDCMQGYFDYGLVTECGIPQITLEGSVSDWENLLNKVRRLEELNKDNCLFLDFWLKHLIPIVESICETGISRKPNQEFWSRIYKYLDHSGTSEISGWCTVFLPYLAKGPNPFNAPAKISTTDIPKQVSSVPFTWEYHQKTMRMRFHGGFLAAKIEKKIIEPAYFWAVTHE